LRAMSKCRLLVDSENVRKVDHQPDDMSDGIYDDGGWMCGGGIGRYVE
jgi:hypothetical protein